MNHYRNFLYFIFGPSLGEMLDLPLLSATLPSGYPIFFNARQCGSVSSEHLSKQLKVQ
jgi:hypothetical protein